MAQCNWTYIGDNGKKFHVGLFHGPKTGHVLIHCNKKVVQIDFSVLESKTYSLFLDEELCEIDLERKEGYRFSYEFRINKEVDTPRNRQRKAIEKKHWKQSLLFFGAILLCVGLFTFWFMSNRDNLSTAQKEFILETTGQETLGKVFLQAIEDNGITYRYSFVANGKSYESSHLLQHTPALSNGMPLESGDEFVVRYSKDRPQLHKINFGKPSEAQLERYWERSFEQHQKLHPEFTVSKIQCQLTTAYELRGIAGLADFYFQEHNEEDNPKHNQLTYLKLVRDLPFQKITKEKCL